MIKAEINKIEKRKIETVKTTKSCSVKTSIKYKLAYSKTDQKKKGDINY